MNTDVFIDDDFEPVVIDTPFLLPNQEEPTPDQATFQAKTANYMEEESQKSLLVRSRYGSGKTYFLQELIKNHAPKRVLFITYRQTLARDIMRNFGRLGFKNYLDAPNDPGVWNSKRLIVQLDSLMSVMFRNDQYLSEDRFNHKFDMIILDESESLLAHLDEKTMENKEIQIFNFFDKLLKNSKKVVFLDGDMSRRSLTFAKSYGDLTYIKNKNSGRKRNMNIYTDDKMWQERLYSDLRKYQEEDPNFKVCLVSQSSNRAVEMEGQLRADFPGLRVKRLIGTDSGMTKKTVMDDVNQTLDDANVFIYSPVIESGVDITVKVKKVYGMLSVRSNCPRAYMQMLARCRDVEDPNIDILNDQP
jgi:hypothetical protein